MSLPKRGRVGTLKKRPRCFHPDEMLVQHSGLQKDFEWFRFDQRIAVDSAKGDAVRFLSEVCHLKPFKYQLDLAEKYRKHQLLAVRWPRQTGKSTVISGLMLQDAYETENLNIAFLGPSWRQTKLNIRRVGIFCEELPDDSCTIQKTRISFNNGSFIEAFPNNPDTIRGHTFHRIWWDECNFTANDEDLYEAILFTLGTTNGKLVASSTPFNSDSLFWKMCNHKNFEKFERHHFSYEKALEPDGPLNASIVEQISEQFGDDRQRWRREMDAEWAEDEDVWLPQSLIVSCVGTAKSCGEDIKGFDADKRHDGEFFAGLDLAQTRDYSVLSVVERVNDRLYLRLVKIFPQPTIYASVLGYLKALQDHWNGFQKIRVDFTREGPSIIADMESAGIENAEGVNFSVPRKSEMASLLKQRMSNHQFYYPLFGWEKPHKRDLCSELNVERFDLRKDGQIGYSHPRGTHDDVFWSVALAVYATVNMEPEPYLSVVSK